MGGKIFNLNQKMGIDDLHSILVTYLWDYGNSSGKQKREVNIPMGCHKLFWLIVALKAEFTFKSGPKRHKWVTYAGTKTKHKIEAVWEFTF